MTTPRFMSPSLPVVSDLTHVSSSVNTRTIVRCAAPRYGERRASWWVSPAASLGNATRSSDTRCDHTLDAPVSKQPGLASRTLTRERPHTIAAPGGEGVRSVRPSPAA